MRRLLMVLLLMLPAAAHAETFQNLGKIADDPGFQERVRVAMASAAQAVYNEAVVPPPSSYAARHAFAIKVEAGSYNVAAASFVVVSNTTVAAEASFIAGGTFSIPDADISNAISASFNGLAGF